MTREGPLRTRCLLRRDELNVRRVLALAALSAPIRKLYADEEIDRETVRR